MSGAAAFTEGLAELHTHLGGSVASDILWSLAHEQGIALPVKDYWEFDALVTVSDARGVENLDALDRIYHWTELIQSSPLAVERSVHGAIGGAYRSQRITTLELRFNPMKRNRGGERDLDHVILAAVRGLDRASMEYPQVRCGLILMMDRTFTQRQNEVVVEKAISWASRGIVGIDVAGPRPGGERYDYRGLEPMVEAARGAGLGVTIHVGEEGATGAEEIGEVVEHLRPDRIGHGILAAGDPELMRLLREAGVVLEICPTSNLLTKALPDEAAVRETFHAFPRARRRLHDRDGRAGDDADAPSRRARAPRAHRGARRRSSSARRTGAGTRRASSARPPGLRLPEIAQHRPRQRADENEDEDGKAGDERGQDDLGGVDIRDRDEQHRNEHEDEGEAPSCDTAHERCNSEQEARQCTPDHEADAGSDDREARVAKRCRRRPSLDRSAGVPQERRCDPYRQPARGRHAEREHPKVCRNPVGSSASTPILSSTPAQVFALADDA